MTRGCALLALWVPLLEASNCDGAGISGCQGSDMMNCDKPCDCMVNYGLCLRNLGCTFDMYEQYAWACWRECESSGLAVCPHPTVEKLPNIDRLTEILSSKAVDAGSGKKDTVIVALSNAGYTELT